MDIARRYRLPGIALLLDQEKAYDRVHPTYLCACLFRFGFPTQFVDCITSLFFNTSLCVKVNGFLSTAFAQERGLRQGDPLSSFLFNLALEPLLRAIHTCPLLPGFLFDDPAISQMPQPIGRPPVLKLLAYADDVLVFLKDPIELTSLLALINAYELASNAKLNLDKAIAVSLSGHSQPLWRRCLQHRGITHWHDSSSHVAAIYLGFPLTSSSAQLTTFLDEILGSTRLIVHCLAFWRLSVQGRGLIANTLILSRVWHSLRVLAVPAYFLDKIRSIVDQFINSKSFPKVSFDTCRRPRKEGGLAVLDPATQLHALQLCWLRPLAQPDTESNYNHSFALQALQYCLCSFSGSSSPVLSLAFVELRSPDVKAMGCCKLLFRVMDMLDFSVNWEALNISLVLEIPVSRIYLSLPTFNGRGRRTNWGQLRMKDVFEYNPIHNCLRRRPHLSSTRFKHRASRFYSLLADGQSPVHSSIEAFFTPQNLRTDSQLQYTLYRLPQPKFEDMLTVELSGAMDFDHITLKLFRTSKLLPIDALPAHYLRGPATAWRKFWLSSFPHQAHTVLWRYYHRKLPTRQRLHQICPDRHLDPFCLLCGGVEDDEHFLWSCVHKKETWSRIVNRFLPPTARLTYDSLALGSSTDIQVLSGLRVDGHTIIACTVWAIWRCHWRFVFDGRTFWPDEAAARATQAIKRIHDENSYRESQKSLRSD
jgi:hypothetical protein